jgi:hypothetical protein
VDKRFPAVRTEVVAFAFKQTKGGYSMKYLLKLLVSAAVATMCSGSAANAQSIEIHGYGSTTFDLPGARAVAGLATPDTTTGFSTFQLGDSGERRLQPSVGGGGSIGFKHAGVYVDYSYILSDQRSVTVSDTSTGAFETVTDKRSFKVFQSGLQLDIPTQYKVVPYFQVGGGFLHQSETGTQNGGGVSNPGFFSGNISKNNPLLHGGFGIQYILKSGQHGRRFGIRAGVDGYYLRHPVFQPSPSVSPSGGFANFNNPRHGFARATFGFFYQFH